MWSCSGRATPACLNVIQITAKGHEDEQFDLQQPRWLVIMATGPEYRVGRGVHSKPIARSTLRAHVLISCAPDWRAIVIYQEASLGNQLKPELLSELRARYGKLRKLEGSRSLFEVGDSRLRVYVRYSKLHGQNRTFFGLRQEDIRQLEGHPSVVCFLWDGQQERLMVPFADFEEVFHSVSPASDGQFKVQVCLSDEGTELYIARAGRFSVEAYWGWQAADTLCGTSASEPVPSLSHSQIQTLLGAIGSHKQYDIWVPQNDRSKLDWTLARRFDCRDTIHSTFDHVRGVVEEVDVIWIQRGSGTLRALFEIEHSSPIYSGLLRFNDVHLVHPNARPTFSIVANEEKRGLFVRQLARPTFQTSGLSELCTFMDYANVLRWYQRVVVP